MGLTTDKDNKCLNETKDNGQQECYLVLSEEEKAKGFIRPVRESYIHVGKKVDIEGEIKTLEYAYEDNDGAKPYYNGESGYVAYLEYPESMSPLRGKYIKQDELDAFNAKKYVGGCNTKTTMALGLAETYARDPNFYGSTYCCGCRTHLPVAEFRWDGSDEILGS